MNHNAWIFGTLTIFLLLAGIYHEDYIFSIVGMMTSFVWGFVLFKEKIKEN